VRTDSVPNCRRHAANAAGIVRAKLRYRLSHSRGLDGRFLGVVELAGDGGAGAVAGDAAAYVGGGHAGPAT